MRRVAFLTLVLLSVSFAGAGGSPSTARGQDLDPESMQRWMEFMTPGEEHQRLKERAGRWNLSVKMWMAPEAPPTESQAESEATMIMGDRYLVEKITGEMMGESFEGLGITGYNKGTNKFVNLWIDNMGTGFMLGEGTLDDDRNQTEIHSTAFDPMTGRDRQYRTTERKIDDDHWVMEMYTREDGSEFKSLEIQYSRAR